MTPSKHCKYAAVPFLCDNAKLPGKRNVVDTSHGAPQFRVDFTIDSVARRVEVPTRRFATLFKRNSYVEAPTSCNDSKFYRDRRVVSASRRPVTRSFPFDATCSTRAHANSFMMSATQMRGQCGARHSKTFLSTLSSDTFTV
jgi:hypothetical protein